jgi:polyhydroxybutyrate depolymerase
MMKYDSFLAILLLLSILTFSTMCSCRQPDITLPLVTPAENHTSYAVPPAASTPPASGYSGSLLAGGLQRTYLVHLPSGYDKNRLWPLVIVLHGGGGQGKNVDALTGFNSESDREGFIAVYPDAVGRNWNDGRGDPNIKSQATDIDDVSFISALINRLEGDLSINNKMIFVTGISNGAMMSHRLGCELSAKIAAIAPVAGNIPEKMKPAWSPSHPLSVLIINGTDDPLVPWNGGDVTFLTLKRGRVISVGDTVKFWLANNGCAAVPETYQLPDTDTTDGTTTTVESYKSCRGKAEVVLYTVKGGGHIWPGGLQYMNESLIGKTSRDFNATATIWQFFKQHPMN